MDEHVSPGFFFFLIFLSVYCWISTRLTFEAGSLARGRRAAKTHDVSGEIGRTCISGFLTFNFYAASLFRRFAAWTTDSILPPAGFLSGTAPSHFWICMFCKTVDKTTVTVIQISAPVFCGRCQQDWMDICKINILLNCAQQ